MDRLLRDVVARGAPILTGLNATELQIRDSIATNSKNGATIVEIARSLFLSMDEDVNKQLEREKRDGQQSRSRSAAQYERNTTRMVGERPSSYGGVNSRQIQGGKWRTTLASKNVNSTDYTIGARDCSPLVKTQSLARFEPVITPLSLVSSIQARRHSMNNSVFEDGPLLLAKKRILLKQKGRLDNLLSSREREIVAAASTTTSSTNADIVSVTLPTENKLVRRDSSARRSKPFTLLTGGSRTRRVGEKIIGEKIDPARARKRDEIYAINAYLRKLEIAKFNDFLDEMNGKPSLDDLSCLSWSSSQSSLMPSPHYHHINDKPRPRLGGV